MKFVRNILAMLAAVAAFSGCSSSDNVAGNSAETGSPELAGILVLDGGKPAAYARVQCVPENYDVMTDAELPAAYSTETDKNGRYRLDSVPDGIYAIEAFHAQSGKRLLVRGVKVAEDDSVAVSDTLRAPGVVKLELVDSYNEHKVVVVVPGTTIRRETSIRDFHELVVDSLPAGELDLQIYFDGLYWSSVYEVEVAPGDTQTILIPSAIEPDVVIPHDSVSYTWMAPLSLPEGVDTLTSSVTDIPIALRLTEENCNFDSLQYITGRWEAVRISKDGSRSKKLPVSFHELATPGYGVETKQAVVWVRVDSLNVTDSLELSYDGLRDQAYAFDVFPTNRSYSLVWHFGYAVSPQTDYAEMGDFDGTAFGSVDADAITEGVVGIGIEMDSAGSFYVKSSARMDTTRKVNMSFDEDGYFCFSTWVELDALDKEQTVFEKAKEYALRYVPEKGFVVEVYHVADSSDALDTASYKVSWASGTDGIKAGEWTYVAFSRRAFEQTVFYVNDAKVSASPEKSDWDDTNIVFSLEPSDRSDSVSVRAYFEVGGFTGKLDELMVGGCFRDETWTRLTYLNQKPESYWPILLPRD
jgi:hypothetical protein